MQAVEGWTIHSPEKELQREWDKAIAYCSLKRAMPTGCVCPRMGVPSPQWGVGTGCSHRKKDEVGHNWWGKALFTTSLQRGGWDSGIGEDLFLLIAVDLMPWQLRKKLHHSAHGPEKGQSIGTETWAGIWGFPKWTQSYSHEGITGSAKWLWGRGHVKTAGIKNRSSWNQYFLSSILWFSHKHHLLFIFVKYYLWHIKSLKDKEIVKEECNNLSEKTFWQISILIFCDYKSYNYYW